MIRVLSRDANGNITTDIQGEQLPDLLKDSKNLLWVDMAGAAPEQVESLLEDTFGFHALSVDDAINENHLPKIDEWHNYLFLVLRAAVARNDGLELPELDLFLGSNFLVTYSPEAIAEVERVWGHCRYDDLWLSHGPAYLLYRLADELVAGNVAIVESMHSALDGIEEQIFGESQPDTLEDLFALKRNILKVRRIVVTQRDVLQALSRNRYEVIAAEDRIYFRDVYDHLLRLNDLLDELLILVGSALDTYLSVVNNRMNDVMKTLTVITALFMPLAFVTGFFGMNFFQASMQLDAWTGRVAFIGAMVIMLVVPLIMYWWMRHRTWI